MRHAHPAVSRNANWSRPRVQNLWRSDNCARDTSADQTDFSRSFNLAFGVAYHSELNYSFSLLKANTTFDQK